MNQKQNSGDNSQNIQVMGNLVLGINEQRAKEIADEVFKSNFIRLKEDAHNIAIGRAESLFDNFIKSLTNKNFQNFEIFKDPGFLSVLFDAQKAYASTGDKNLEEILVNLLVERTNELDRNLFQIILNESITTVQKLTSQQLDILTLIVLLTRTMNNSINDFNSLVEFLKMDILPFTYSLTAEPTVYEHLVYSGCCSFLTISFDNKVEKILQKSFGGLFMNGFTTEDFISKVGEVEKYHELIIPSEHSKNKYQLKFINEKSFLQMLEENYKDHNLINQIKKLIEGKYRMSPDEVASLILERVPEIKALFEIWGNSRLFSLAMTGVGITIALANYKRKTGENIDLHEWIKS